MPMNIETAAPHTAPQPAHGPAARHTPHGPQLDAVTPQSCSAHHQLHRDVTVSPLTRHSHHHVDHASPPSRLHAGSLQHQGGREGETRRSP